MMVETRNDRKISIYIPDVLFGISLPVSFQVAQPKISKHFVSPRINFVNVNILH